MPSTSGQSSRANALRILALLCVGIGSIASAFGAPIKVGVIVSATGPSSESGLEVVNSTKLAELLFPGQFEFVRRDDGGQPDAARRLLQELAQEDKVFAVIGPTTASSQASMNADVGPVPIISLARRPAAPEQRRPNLFRIGPNRGNLVSVAASYLTSEFKPSKIVLIDPSDVLRSSVSSLFGNATVVRTGRTIDDVRGDLVDAQAVFADITGGGRGPLENLRLIRSNTSATIVTFTFSTIDAFSPPPEGNAYVAAAPKLVGDGKYSTMLFERYQQQFGHAASAGYLLDVMRAVLSLKEVARLKASNPVEFLRVNTMQTDLGPIHFGMNGDAIGPGIGAAIWRVGQPAGAVASATGVTETNCKDTDGCKSDCCVRGGCDPKAGSCKDFKCTN